MERADEGSIKTMTENGAIPGNSVKEVGERIKGGAVSDERSPEKEAILISGKEREAGEGGWYARLEERRPASALGYGYGLGSGEWGDACGGEENRPRLAFRTWWWRKERERRVGERILRGRCCMM